MSVCTLQKYMLNMLAISENDLFYQNYNNLAFNTKVDENIALTREAATGRRCVTQLVNLHRRRFK